MPTELVPRKTDTLAAVVVLALGLPLVALGLSNVARVWQSDGEFVAWQVAFVLVVLVGIRRSARVMRERHNR